MHLKSLEAPKLAPQTAVSAVAMVAAAKRPTRADVFSNFFSPLVALIPTPRAGASPASLGPRLQGAALQRFSTAEEHRAPPSGAKRPAARNRSHRDRGAPAIGPGRTVT